jgi:hypothetical protein
MAPSGNQNACKLLDPVTRKKVYDAYVSWLSKGKSKKSFHYEDELTIATYLTVEKYMKEDPEFNPIHIQQAYAKGYAKWEQIVEDSASGINEKANTASLQMVMRNKFDWDKEDKSKSAADVAKLELLEKFFEKIDSHVIQISKHPVQQEEQHTDHSE